MEIVKVETGTIWGRNRMTLLGTVELMDYPAFISKTDTAVPGVRLDFYSPAHRSESGTANVVLDTASARKLAQAILVAADDADTKAGERPTSEYELPVDVVLCPHCGVNAWQACYQADVVQPVLNLYRETNGDLTDEYDEAARIVEEGPTEEYRCLECGYVLVAHNDNS